MRLAEARAGCFIQELTRSNFADVPTATNSSVISPRSAAVQLRRLSGLSDGKHLLFVAAKH